jgi:hypothetical protein
MEVGVLVDVAKRSCVGNCVTVGAGVKVSAGGCGVGVNSICRRGPKLEHPLRRAVIKMTGMSFFIGKPFATIKD